jgi:hypothetical protein
MSDRIFGVGTCGILMPADVQLKIGSDLTGSYPYHTRL